MRRCCLSLLAIVSGCSDEVGPPLTPVDPDTAPIASVDRFSDGFATLFKRSGPAFDPVNLTPRIPAPNAPIDFDAVFAVRALGPAGEPITYYSLDIVPQQPARGYVLVANGAPVAGQLPIIDLLPGEVGYNDFVRVTEVEVGRDYVANAYTSVADLEAAVAGDRATLRITDRVENWSAIPRGSTATKRFHGRRITGERVWVRGQVADILLFESGAGGDALTLSGEGLVPTSPIIVIFANDMSPAAGFATEPDGRTHNAIASLPGQGAYSSLWAHSVGALAGFASVVDFASASANIAVANIPVDVNCPVVE